jgi:Dockerin type I domain
VSGHRHQIATTVTYRIKGTLPTSTTWENAVTLSLGDNNFTLYGTDDESNQTATQTITVGRHTLGDINGDGEVDLIDASLFAVDWDKTSGLTYILSDMNDDGEVNLVDLSILAKLID